MRIARRCWSWGVGRSPAGMSAVLLLAVGALACWQDELVAPNEPIGTTPFLSLAGSNNLRLVSTEFRISWPGFDWNPVLGSDGASHVVAFNGDYNADGLREVFYQRVGRHGLINAPILVGVGGTDDEIGGLSGDYIVYTAYIPGSNPPIGEVMLFEISTGVEIVLSDLTYIRQARIHDRVIAWIEASLDGSAARVFLYTLDALARGERPLPITHSVPPVRDVEIGDRLVVWTEHSGTQFDVMAAELSPDPVTWWSIGPTLRIAADPVLIEHEPATSGPWVVWQSRPPGKSVPIRIEAYNVASGERRTIVDDGARNFSPAIDVDFVAYVSDVAGNLDVYLHRLSSGQTFQVTNEPADQESVDVFGGLEGFGGIVGDDMVTYIDARDGNYDVFVRVFTFEPVGNTEPGSEVIVEPVDPATGDTPVALTFDQVLSGGETTVTSGTVGGGSGPPPPANFRLGSPPTYYNVETTAAFDGTVTVCLDYSGASYGNENQLKLLHGETDASGNFVRWVDVTTSLDTENNIICGTVSSLSPFLAAEENAAPAVVSITLPADPIAVVRLTSVSARFTDANPTDVHTGTIDWGDGTGLATASIGELAGAGTASGSHTYAAPGVYTVTVAVSDGNLQGSRTSAADVPAYVVVYDPDGGFATGGGWIHSEAGWCQLGAQCATASGKASFGFVSKYLRGASVPSGNTEFEFRAGGLHFRSTAYEWLVVAGPKAQYKGSGTINGGGDYGFMLTANDGQVNGGLGVDRFRIKIWDNATGVVVYDNQLGDSDGGPATTALGGGSVVIHAK